MKVVELRPDTESDDLVKALRNIADDIENGEVCFRPTLAVVVLADELQTRDKDGISLNFNWQTHGLGRNAGYFVTKGILASAMARMENGADE